MRNVMYGQKASKAYMRRLARTLGAADWTEIVIAEPAEDSGRAEGDAEETRAA